MKAPDKIYLNKYMIRPGMLYPAQYPADTPEFEYIRKDTLLEYANNGIKRVKEDSSLNSIIAQIAIAAFEELIEKLNSM